MSTRIGGSFAPPLTVDKIDAYAALAATAPPQVKDAMSTLLVLAREYQKHPTATSPSKPHPSGRGTIVPLAVAVADAIDPLVPWDEELAMFAAVFEKIDATAGKPLRDAAFHLLWYARELSIGRDPLTTDKLP